MILIPTTFQVQSANLKLYNQVCKSSGTPCHGPGSRYCSKRIWKIPNHGFSIELWISLKTIKKDESLEWSDLKSFIICVNRIERTGKNKWRQEKQDKNKTRKAFSLISRLLKFVAFFMGVWNKIKIFCASIRRELRQDPVVYHCDQFSCILSKNDKHSCSINQWNMI